MRNQNLKMKKQKKQKSKKELNLEIPVRDAGGKKCGTITLNDKVFDGRINTALVHQVITMYQANQRSGSACTKTRAEVRGGGKKPWRQKGTGRARTGSIRNPLWKGGGTIFGPKPRDFSYAIPQKARARALRSGLNSKLIENNLMVIDGIELNAPKTKAFKSILTALGIGETESALFIIDKIDRAVKLASRNIPKVLVRAKDNVNAMDIIRHKKLIIQESALNTLMRNLK